MIERGIVAERSQRIVPRLVQGRDRQLDLGRAVRKCFADGQHVDQRIHFHILLQDLELPAAGLERQHLPPRADPARGKNRIESHVGARVDEGHACLEEPPQQAEFIGLIAPGDEHRTAGFIAGVQEQLRVLEP